MSAHLLHAGVVIGAFLIFAWCSARKAAGSDEMWFLLGAKDLALTGIPWRNADGEVRMLHPPLYLHLIALSYLVFGFHVWSAKLVGVICALGLLAATIGFLSSSQRWVWTLVLMLIGSNPLFIQSAVLLDSDNTILSALLLVFLFAWINIEQKNTNHRGCWGLGCIFGASLWAKLTTPPILAGVLFSFLTVRRRTDLLRRVLIPGVTIGTCLFFSTFWTYCRWKGLQWTQPFEYLFGAFRGYAVWNLRSGNGLWVLKNLVEFLLWIQPSLAILFCWACIARIREIKQGGGLRPDDLLWVFASALILGYLIVGGTNFGFPRYFSPVVIPMCLVGWRFVAPALIAPSERWGRFLSFSAMLLVFQVWLIGDPLHTLRYDLRESLINRGPMGIPLGTLISQVTLSLVVSFLVWCVYMKWETGKAVIRVALFYTVLMQSAGLDISQAHAAYNTNYNYGETGTAAVIAEIASTIAPGEKVLATLEVTGGLTWAGVHTEGTSIAVWNDPRILAARIRDPQTAYVVYSLTSNTVDQYRVAIADLGVQTALHEKFRAARTGGYTIWKRER